MTDRTDPHRYSLPEAMEHLSAVDPVMKKIIAAVGPYERKRRPSGFGILARAIVNQQLSGKAAATILARLRTHFPAGRLTPQAALALSHDTLTGCGLSRNKAAFLHALADEFASGRISTRALVRLSDDDARERLCRLHGIGPWTAEMFLMFCLDRPDIFPVGDAGIRRAIVERYPMRGEVTPERMIKLSRRWRPYRSVASRFLWRALDQVPA